MQLDMRLLRLESAALYLCSISYYAMIRVIYPLPRTKQAFLARRL